MSAGSHRDRVGDRLVKKAGRGSAKPSREGWGYAPDGLLPVLLEVLEAKGLLALAFLIGVLHLTNREIMTCELEGALLVAYDHRGEPSLRAELPRDIAELVGSFILVRPKSDRVLSDQLTKTVGREVRRRLKGEKKDWAQGLHISATFIGRIGWDLALRRYRDRPDILRALARSRYARADTLGTAVTAEVAEAIDEARSDFFNSWAAQLSPAAREAHERIAASHGVHGAARRPTGRRRR